MPQTNRQRASCAAKGGRDAGRDGRIGGRSHTRREEATQGRKVAVKELYQVVIENKVDEFKKEEGVALKGDSRALPRLTEAAEKAIATQKEANRFQEIAQTAALNAKSEAEKAKKTYLSPVELEAMLREAFAYFDKDGSNAVMLGEMDKAMDTLFGGDKPPEAESHYTHTNPDRAAGQDPPAATASAPSCRDSIRRCR